VALSPVETSRIDTGRFLRAARGLKTSTRSGDWTAENLLSRGPEGLRSTDLLPLEGCTSNQAPIFAALRIHPESSGSPPCPPSSGHSDASCCRAARSRRVQNLRRVLLSARQRNVGQKEHGTRICRHWVKQDRSCLRHEVHEEQGLEFTVTGLSSWEAQRGPTGNFLERMKEIASGPPMMFIRGIFPLPPRFPRRYQLSPSCAEILQPAAPVSSLDRFSGPGNLFQDRHRRGQVADGLTLFRGGQLEVMIGDRARRDPCQERERWPPIAPRGTGSGFAMEQSVRSAGVFHVEHPGRATSSWRAELA
jgi:hypothetical protein